MEKFDFKRIALYFVIIFAVFTALSWNDMRPADGPLQVGYPLVFMTQSSGFSAEPVDTSPQYDVLALLGNVVIYIVIAFVIVFAVKRIKKA